MALSGPFRAGSLVNLVRQRLPMQVCQSHTADLDRGGMDKAPNRDYVCYGMSGNPMYVDRIDFPFPSVRFKENTPDVMALREKEKGDWSKLTIEEKKTLYRASFCQTFQEFYAPTGNWKAMIATFLCIAATAMWLFLSIQYFVYRGYPKHFNDEDRKELMKAYIAMRINPIEGLGSKYDYEKGRWKE